MSIDRYVGLVLYALVTAANVQDCDGGVLLLSPLFGHFPFLRKLLADSAMRARSSTTVAP
jgi:hypothetical protein